MPLTEAAVTAAKAPSALGTAIRGAVPQGVQDMMPTLRRSAGQYPGDINIASQAMFGVRRALEAQKPEIPRLLDEGWNGFHQATRDFDSMIGALTKRTGIGPGDPRLQQVIDAAEGKLPVTSLDPAQRDLHTFWTSARDKFATLQGLDPNQKMQDYFTHVVEPMNVPRIIDVLADRAPRSVLSAADQYRLKAVHRIAERLGVPSSEALNLYQTSKQSLQDMVNTGQVPRSVFNAFEQIRQGFPVYSQDFYDVMRTYGRAVYRQHYLEPALRQVSVLSETLPPNLKQELALRVQHGILRRPTQTESLLNRAFAPMDTFIQTITGGRIVPGPRAAENAVRSVYSNLALWDIGFNPSPIKKHFAADMMSIYAELGERSTAVGFARSVTPEGRAFAKQFGNVQERMPDLELFDDYLPPIARGAKQLWNGVHKAAFFAYTKIDLLNQYTAWLGGFDKAMRQGLPQQAAIEYANRVTRYTVPRQTPLDIPGIMKSPIGKLAFQFSSKKMQRAELIWDQFKRIGDGDFGPIGRTVIGTALVTGLPFDEWFAKKTGLDPERLPFYDVLGKMGFGMRKVLHSWAPSLGPALQLTADIARVGHDPTRLLDRAVHGLADTPFGRDIYTDATPLQVPGTGISPVPLAARTAIRLKRELETGEYRSRYGEKIADITPRDAIARAAGFDPPPVVHATQAFADAMHEYHMQLGDISHKLSMAYDTNVKVRNDWSGFYKALAAIQAQHPDMTITDSLIQRALERSEIDRMSRLTKRAPKGFLASQEAAGGR